MNGKQLKNSILQWAIQGKLVPQDPNDEPASVLLDKIRQEKERLIKEKKIKRDKNASIIYRGEDNSYYEKLLATGEVKCIDEEVPFEIPTSWSWARLGNLIDIKGGKRLPAGYKLTDNKTDHIYIRVSDMQDGTIVSKNLKYITDDVYNQIQNYTIGKDDLYLTIVGSTIGKAGLVPKMFDNMNLTENAVKLTNIPINKYFLLYYVRSEYAQSQFRDNTKQVGQPKLAIFRIANTLVPIPPFAEQTKIVSKIEYTLHFVNHFSNLQEQLHDIDTDIYRDLKKSILQEAIQGKLVPQIAEEGTAKELLEQIKAEKQKLVKEGKLKKSALASSVIFRGDDNKYWEKTEDGTVCIDEEIPFEIPSNWAWVRLDDICSFIHRGKSPKYSPIKKYPVVAQKCNQWDGFSIEKAKFIEPQSISSYNEEYFLQDRDLMWNSTGLGTLGRMAIYYMILNPYELAVADSHVTVIRPYKTHIVSEYLYYYFASNTVQSVIEDKSDGSTKQKELATKTVKAYLVPIPPFAEQQRIVQKIKSVTSIMSR